MRGARRVNDQRLRIAEVGHDTEDLRAVDEALSSFIALLQTEGNDTAEASLEIAVTDSVVLVRLQTWIVDPRYLGLIL